jgi:hypothetical protein
MEANEKDKMLYTSPNWESLIAYMATKSLDALLKKQQTASN